MDKTNFIFTRLNSPFNFDVVAVNDPELRSILEELIEEMWDSTEVKNMDCPRLGIECNEFMCGSCIDGICQES